VPQNEIGHDMREEFYNRQELRESCRKSDSIPWNLVTISAKVSHELVHSTQLLFFGGVCDWRFYTTPLGRRRTLLPPAPA